LQLWKHPNGTYYVLYGPRLKKQLSTRTKDRGEADRFLSQFIEGTQNPQPDAPTVGLILDGYAASRSPDVAAPDTIKYSVLALQPRLGHFQPDDLLPHVIKKYAAERGAKPGTILRELGVLRAALSWAVDHKWIGRAPAIIQPVRAPKGRERWLSRDEARSLLAACHALHLKLFVMLGLMTGARSGAILELQWSQVDMARRLIDYGEGHGNKRRVIAPINDDLHATLTAALELACSDFVIEQHGKQIGTVKNGFGAAVARAGLTDDVTPHILRHTCATWLVEAGMEDEAARLLGDSVATIRRVYGHHSPEYLKRATGALKLSGGPAETP